MMVESERYYKHVNYSVCDDEDGDDKGDDDCYDSNSDTGEYESDDD